MEKPTRDFTPQRAKRGDDILQIGLMGPPGGGKTYSALELATGIQRVRGGDIILVETEGRRSLKLADYFNFQRVGLDPPHSSIAFLDAILALEKLKPACIIIDCLSDEHEGTGGLLQQHDDNTEKAVERARSKNDSRPEWQIAEASGQSAWIKPKADRLKFILAMDRFTVPVIYTFRAREKVKPIKNERGKMAPTNVGYQPIAPVEIVHKLDMTCLLPANARGVPEWKSEKAGEDFFIKLPEYLVPYIREGKRIDADLGEAFAHWMKNDKANPLDRGREAAKNGSAALLAWWNGLGSADKKALKPALDTELKKLATDADSAATQKPTVEDEKINKAAGASGSAPERDEAPTPAVATGQADAPQASANAAGKASAVTQAILMDRLRGCSTVEGVKRVEADAESLPADQRAELLVECARHADFL